MKKSLVIFGIATLSFTACYKIESFCGGGSVRLGVDFPETKAALSSADLLANSLVNIYYADFSGLVRSYKYSKAPSEIFLPENEYRVDVIAGEAAKEIPSIASWEQKSYKGSKTFTIKSGKSTSVEVVAKISNAMSKVTFDQSISENFDAGYAVKIGIGDNKLTYKAENSGAEGYFLITGMDEPQFDWTFTGKLAKDGSEFTKSGTIKSLEAGKLYGMTLKYTLKDGLGAFSLYVDYATTVVTDDIVFEPVSTGLAASAYKDIWAAHATVYADVDETEYTDPTAVSFAYSKDGTNWSSAAATRVSEGSYRATLTSLSASTKYTYKLVIGGNDVGDPSSFTTDAAPVVPNGNFEVTSKSADGNYYEWYNTGASDLLCRTPWWGSGNGSDGISGSAAYKVICKPDTENKVEGNQSACLQSQYAVVKFAAGNLFTGFFAGLVGTEGGRVNFGRPFTARPTGLKFWAKYVGGKITDINGLPSGVSLTKNDYDCGRIQFALGYWDRKTYGGTNECPVQVNTTNESTFINYNTDAKTIAYGELLFQSSANDNFGQWKEYYIPLNYRDTDTPPTHIIISGAASMYGDYFTGCRTASMWLDKMEFVYE